MKGLIAHAKMISSPVWCIRAKEMQPAKASRSQTSQMIGVSIFKIKCWQNFKKFGGFD